MKFGFEFVMELGIRIGILIFIQLHLNAAILNNGDIKMGCWIPNLESVDGIRTWNLSPYL